MRLKSVYISDYKNLKKFTLQFDGSSFIDVFVGKNGTGKSNLFEALIEIFRHLDQLGHTDNEIDFEYKLNYEIDGKDIKIEWKGGKLRINHDTDRKTLGQTPFPDNVLIYYSGHNTTVSELVARYEEKFADRIKKADLGESRRFMGIGPKYKALLLAVLLVQPDNSPARKYICKRLGIDKLGIAKPGTDEITESVLRIELQRPGYAEGKNEFNIENNDETDRYWKVEGITKDFLDNLNSCIWSNTDNLTVTEGYLPNDDRYVLYLSISKMQQAFAGKFQELFRQFDNLKTLGMLADITVPLLLTSGTEGNLSHFSDGQFQSVYIYSIVELFKDRNCLTLLDEPDAFLHPEWQFNFLKQVFEITDTPANNNHVLMSSHSAVTLIPHAQKCVKLFNFTDGKMCCHNVNKRYAINQLSSDMMRYSESEQILSILHSINIERKPVFFTEGSTDPLILKEAWLKLYPDPMPFIPIYAFNCIYLKAVLQDERILNELRGKPMFGLFDFDEAYNEWNHLKGVHSQTDPYLGLRVDIEGKNSYAFMMPVPNIEAIERQVIKNKTTKATYLHKSRLAIEHLFYEDARAQALFSDEDIPGGGSVLVFNENAKTRFAEEIVPMIEKSHFEVFRPMFEFVKSKCPV